MRNFYQANGSGSSQYRGEGLRQELRLANSVVLCSIIKWCWSRMPGGVVTWPVYEGFQIGERDSHLARNAFEAFIPIGASTPARKNIIMDFFDLLAAVAAHGKMNGLGGRKLSRLAGWWAFEHSDDGKGFEGGYRSWAVAADASSHLFFAYLRSLSPEADPSMSVIERIPRSLQALLAQTEYPPETPTLLQRSTPRMVMLVDTVSPTPFALLRRAKHFEYRERDETLKQYSEFGDPVDALTNECKRVLYEISSVNSSNPLSRNGNNVKTGQESWSAFQNLGFSDLDEKTLSNNATNGVNGNANRNAQGIRSDAMSKNIDQGRPMTPSWADFLSSGFAEDEAQPNTLSLPSNQRLPPLGSRANTPRSVPSEDENLAPGELAAITNVELDDAFWWVWMTSLAGEEPAERKSVFGRCALIETTIMNGRWLVMEEQVKGASPEPTEGAYVMPKKKSIFSFTKRGRSETKRTKSDRLSPEPVPPPMERIASATPSKSSLAPDQHSKIKATAAALARRQTGEDIEPATRRGRHDDAASTKTNTMMTTGMMSDASPAMKWANNYDKNAVRKQYLGDSFAGKGLAGDRTSSIMTGASSAGPALSPAMTSFPVDHQKRDRNLPALPPKEQVAGASEEEAAPVGPANEVQPATLPDLTPAPSAPQSKTPLVNVQAVEDDTADEAEDAPLPAAPTGGVTSTLDKETAVDTPRSHGLAGLTRKPVPRADHPAFRQRADDESVFTSSPVESHHPKDTALIAAQKAMDSKQPSSSPESLHKAELDPMVKKTGLKKLFGRQKNNPNRMSVEAGPRPGSSSLAPPPTESTLGRRLSLMRRKTPRGTTPNASQVAIAQPQTVHEANEPSYDSSMAASSTNISRARTNDSEAAKAEAEFSRFDQNQPEVHEMPVAPRSPPSVAEFHDEALPAPAPQRQFNTLLASRIAPSPVESTTDEQPDRAENNEAYATPLERGSRSPVARAVDDDAQSEASMEPQQPVPVASENDRWAKIRENAARRAARASEENGSRPSHSISQSVRETDDGETSGEESKSIILVDCGRK